METEFVQMHPDFAHLQVRPGTMHTPANDDRFSLVNLLAFGGAADKSAHMPAFVGQLGEVVLWESTGAPDALPFWNTNYVSDVYLVLLEGEVRMEFKEPESEGILGYYLARGGDLVKLPRAVAHRTFSTSGKRRISLEILERNPLWARVGELAGVPTATEPTLGGFRFRREGDEVVIDSPAGVVRTSARFFLKGLSVLVPYELHFDHNEFEGGFVVHDLDDHVLLKAPGYSESFAPAAVLALFKGLLARFDEPARGNGDGTRSG